MIPENAQKPDDARFTSTENKGGISSHKIRPLLRRTITQLFEDNKTQDSFLTMQQTLSYYASLLLRIYSEKDCSVLGSQELAFVENSMKSSYPDYESIPDDYNTQAIQQQIFNFQNNKALLTDSLSWAYQYLKKYCPSDLSSTQFFTERYMISTLVDFELVNFDDIILDPSCGGGNFLVYVYERKLSDYYARNDCCSIDTLNSLLATLKGYDLDGFLSLVCYLNLIIATVGISYNHDDALSVDDLSDLRTYIFANVDDNIGGFLDKGDSIIVNVCTGERMPLSELMGDVNYIFTNPPFETIKGMKKELKDFLKEDYPLCKCDLCVAFLLKIVESIPPGVRCGLVLQNSWMYLKSFNLVRNVVCDGVALNRMILLGSGSFSDITGEKASVSLVNLSKTDIDSNVMSFIDLTSFKRPQKESLLVSDSCNYAIISQSSLFGMDGSIKNDIIDRLVKDNVDYSRFAVPMQGTSTGDSKRLIDYYWRHLKDPNWKLVSKGGGYSRWYGLNHYSLHWGTDGEIIKETPGSALRNVNKFKDTSMVFSDTGTSGLNVRSLCDGQLFVASGPGIRILSGDIFNHLALLNSKYASYCIRCFTPKLTIAAGYIAKIPVNEEIFSSDKLSLMGERCHAIKKAICNRRPVDIGFNPDFMKNGLYECVEEFIIREFNEELEKINLEKEIDDEIFRIMGIDEQERATILRELDSEIEETPYAISIADIDKCLSSVLDYNCVLTRTRTSKKSIGCDGPLEYISHVLHTSPDSVVKIIAENVHMMTKTKAVYLDYVIHSKILVELGFNHSCCEFKSVVEIADSFEDDSDMVASWIRNQFNTVHFQSLQKKPIYYYDECSDSIRLGPSYVN